MNPYYAPIELTVISHALHDESFILRGRYLFIVIRGGPLIIISYEVDAYLLYFVRADVYFLYISLAPRAMPRLSLRKQILYPPHMRTCSLVVTFLVALYCSLPSRELIHLFEAPTSRG